MKKLFKISLLTLPALFLAAPAHAFCPVCTVAVAGGLGLSRYFGIDDTISGLWLGAFTVAISIWTIDWLKTKKWDFKGNKIVTVLFYYALLVVPMYFYDLIGHPLNKFWGVDKLILGTAIGSAFFYGFGKLYYYLKAKNHGHAHFPFEKVILPLSPLFVWTIIFYFLTK